MTNHQPTPEDSNINQVIALAGIVQCAYLVDQISKVGQAPTESLSPSINSLFQFDTETAADVYGGIHGIQLGLTVLNDVLSDNGAAKYRNTIRYALGILYLQKKLSANQDMLNVIRARLDHTALKYEHFTNNINDISASIAAIYQDTISTFRYRLQITGSMQQLQNPVNANTIRALLLAGIRAAVLWRQLGGRRWHLFLSRKRLLQATRETRQYWQ